MGLLAIVYCVGLITNFSIYGIPNKYSLTLFKGWSICCATGGQLRAIRGVNLKRDEGVSLSVFSIECLEDCELIEIPFIATKYMESNTPNAHKVARYLAESQIIELVRFIKGLDKKSILDRYFDLEQTYPGIQQRATQKSIASYLRITPVHLSRIKKSRNKS